MSNAESHAEISQLSPLQKRQLLVKLLQQQAHQTKRYPLSFAQKRLWFLERLQPGLSVYNLPTILRLRGKLHIPALEKSLQTICDRHEVLRTSFVQEDGNPVQNAIAKWEFSLPVVDLRGLGTKQQQLIEKIGREWGLRPFALDRLPLWGAVLLQLQDEEYVLLFVIHHIIADYWSLRVLVRELGLLYQVYSQVPQQPCPLEKLPIQYGDFAVWQQKWLQSAARNTQVAYWLQKLQNYPRELPLATDFPRPPLQSFRGGKQSFALSPELSGKLKRLGQQQGATLFMTLLAGFKVLLYRYSGQEDILVGSTVTSRDRREISQLMGLFVNNLLFRSKLSGNLSFEQLLQQVRDTAIAAFAHQELPFEDLVEQLQPERDLSKNPLFQVMFVLHNTPHQSAQIPGLVIEPLDMEQGTTRFDLSLDMYETPGGLTGVFEYSTDLFRGETIQRMTEHFQRLLLEIVEYPHKRIAELHLLTDRERLLWTEVNNTTTEIPNFSVCELFYQQAQTTPGKIAVEFAGQTLTYQQLYQRVSQLAHYLQQLGIAPETRVGIFCDRSLEMVVALLGVLQARGAYIPLDPAYPQERIGYILQDAEVTVILTQGGLRDLLPESSAQIIDLEEIPQSSSLYFPVAIPSSQIAYIIYTSGSTGKPKGVQILHKSLTNFLIAMMQTPGISPEDRLLAVTTISFDIAALEIFLPLIRGGTVVIAPQEVTRDGEQLAAAITQQITVMQATPATWRLLLTSGWTGKADLKVLCGGEALDDTLAQQLLTVNQEVWNLYGPTETTIWSAVKKLEINQPVTIGHPIANTQFYVLDNYLQPVPVGVPGELYIGGAGVARGYLNRPDLTAEKFIPHPFINRQSGEVDYFFPILYKTGDKAKYLPDGAIAYLGRLDHQVKIRGFRIELGEVEAVLRSHPLVEQAVVIVGEREQLLGYVVLNSPHRDVDGELRTFLTTKLPGYMVPGVFVVLEELPLTPNGKIDRRSLPAPEYLQSQKTVTSKTPTQELLAGIWGQVLGIDGISIEDNFFDLGGHSLLATQVVGQIRRVLGVELPLRDLFATPRLVDLARIIEQMLLDQVNVKIPPILPRQRNGKLPLSFAQERFWVLTQIEPHSLSYHIPLAVQIRGDLDLAILQRSFFQVIQRQEVLRTRFINVEGEARVEILEILNSPNNREWEIPVINLENLSPTAQQEQIKKIIYSSSQQPFDLAASPAVRIKLLILGDNNYIIFLNLHHIIADAWSMGLLVKEISQSYQQLSNSSSPVLTPPLPIQYRDFAAWQRDYLQGEVFHQHLDFWRQHLAHAPALLELPTDFPRPAIQSFQGDIYRFELSTELTQRLKQLSRDNHCTLFMTLLAVWNVLLYRYSGSANIVVGTPIANRQYAETEKIIGCFANTLAFCTSINDNLSFLDLLQQVRENTLAGYAHQDLPFEQLVEAIQPLRSLSYTPIFQVMLILQNLPVTAVASGGLEWEIIDSHNGTSKYDLTLVVAENSAGLSCKLEYSTDLFKSSTITRLAENFHVLLESIVNHPQQRIGEFPILSTKEQELITKWHQTQRDYPSTQYLHQLFEIQVENHPLATAVICGREHITYQELNQKANQLAHYLQKLGVKPEVTVGICTERSPEMLMGLFAILKAGGVYVPLDGNYPSARLELIIQDAQVQVLITQNSLLAKLPNLSIPIINLDTDREVIAREDTHNPSTNITESNLAYLIYTSGTTGIPKGVAISHRSPIILMHWAREIYSSSQLQGVLASTSICFDLSVFEIFVPLSWGGTVILAENALQLPELPAKSQVTLINTVPSAARELVRLQAIPPSVQTINLAGESLPQSLVAELYQQPTIQQVINLYGPSEDTTYSTIAIIPREHQETPTIGRAIANTQAHILDHNLQPVPIGVPGEIYLTGAGVARGYFNRPDLTAEKFIPNPFIISQRAVIYHTSPVMYKTGDRGRYLENGEIEYLGRQDFQVKLRGFRIELGEVETIFNQHPRVSQAIAMVREDVPERQVLVVYIVAQDNLREQDLREYVAAKLPSYMLPSKYVFLEKFPLTSNGKIDRRNLPVPEFIPTENATAPRTDIEQKLVQIWSQVLAVESVGINDNFFGLGGDSILAIQLVAKANQQGLVVFPRQIFQYQTIAELAPIIEMNGEISPGAEIVTGEVPLTPIQRWFFAENQIAPHHWNQAVCLEVTQPLNFDVLQQAWQELINHHDILRSKFLKTNHDWQQIIINNCQLEITYIDMSGDTSELTTITSDAMTHLANQLQASFNLSQPPLLRVAYFDFGSNQNHRLLMIFHHLIIDGVSWRIILEDLRSLYQQLAENQQIKLPPKTTSFQQWSIQLQEYARSQTWDSTLAYWNSLPWEQIQPLPVDFPLGTNTIADINSYCVSLNPEITQALLQQVPHTYHTQINDVLLTALILAFHNWTGDNILYLELEGHGREDLFPNVNLSRTVGWFTSLFPVCLRMGANSSLDISLKSIKEQLRQIPQRGISYGLLRYLTPPEINSLLPNLPSPPVRFNYLGQSDQLFSSPLSHPTNSPHIPRFIPAGEFTGYSRTLEGNRSNLIEINAIVTGGKLRIDWLYSQAIHRPQTIHKLADTYLSKLQEIIQHCLQTDTVGFTPSDFPQMDFTQDELDDLLADL